MIQAFVSLVKAVVAICIIIVTTLITLEIIGQISEAVAADRRRKQFEAFLIRVKEFLAQLRRK